MKKPLTQMLCENFSLHPWTATELVILAHYFYKQRFEAGIAIAHMSEETRELSMVIEGEVELNLGSFHCQLSEGACLGVMALLNRGSKRAVNVKSGSKGCSLLNLSVDNWLALKRGYPSVANRFAEVLWANVAQKTAQIGPQSALHDLFKRSESSP